MKHFPHDVYACPKNFVFIFQVKVTLFKVCIGKFKFVWEKDHHVCSYFELVVRHTRSVFDIMWAKLISVQLIVNIFAIFSDCQEVILATFHGY